MADGKDGRADDDHDDNKVHYTNNGDTGDYHVGKDEEINVVNSKDDDSDKVNNDDYYQHDANGDRGDWTWVRTRVRIDWQPKH